MDEFKDLTIGMFVKVGLTVTKMRKNLTPQSRGMTKETMVHLYNNH